MSNRAVTLLDKWECYQRLAQSPLSHPAVRIAGRLLSHFNITDNPGRCDPSYSTLGKGAGGIDRRNVIRYVQELEAAGFILGIQSKGRGKQNQFALNLEWQPPETGCKNDAAGSVTGTPVDKQVVSQGHQGSVTGTPVGSVTGTPKHGKSKHGKEHGNISCAPGDLFDPSKGSGHNPPVSAKPKTAKRLPVDYDADFTAWYAQYPRKKAPDKARRAYAKARDIASRDELLAGVMRFAAERTGKDPEFIKYPATWLNDQCWLDQPDDPFIAPVNSKARHTESSNSFHRWLEDE